MSARSLFLSHPLGSKITRLLPARLLEREPTNLQALSLDTLIEKAVKRGTPFTHFSSRLLESWLSTNPEGYIGMAIAGGAAAVGTLLLAGLVRRATRK